MFLVDTCTGNRLFIAKYYPSGWYRCKADDFEETLNDFFDNHDKNYPKDLFGVGRYKLVYETDEPDAKHTILNALNKVVEK